MTRRPTPTGDTRIRMPRELHRQLIEEAERQNVSVNHLMVALVAGGMNFKMPKGRSTHGS